MDIKSLPGIPYSIFKDAVMRSRGNCPPGVWVWLSASLCHSIDARCEVLERMAECQPVPRPSIKENGPAYGMV